MLLAKVYFLNRQKPPLKKADLSLKASLFLFRNLSSAAFYQQLPLQLRAQTTVLLASKIQLKWGVKTTKTELHTARPE